MTLERSQKQNFAPRQQREEPHSLLERGLYELVKRINLLRPKGRRDIIERALIKRKEDIEPRRIRIENFAGKRGFVLKAGAATPRSFGQKNVREDMRRVGELQAAVIRKDAQLKARERTELAEKKRVADVLEAVLTAAAPQVFGKNAEIIVPSEFDDWVNGIDLLLVFRDDDGHAQQVFALDFTYASTRAHVEHKFNRSLRGVERDKLTTAVYVATTKRPGETEYFTAAGIPRIILGTSAFSGLMLATDWVNGEYLALEHSGQRKSFLVSLQEQLKGQLRVAKREKKEFAAQELQRGIDRFEGILKDVRWVRSTPSRTTKRITDISRSRPTMRRLFRAAQTDVARIAAEQEEKEAAKPDADKDR